MPRPSCSPRPTPPPLTPDPSPPEELLALLADRLVEAHLGSTAPGAALVRVRPTADGVDLGLCPLPHHLHPVDALVGTTVDRRWSAVGIVTDATAHPIDTEGGLPPDGDDGPPHPHVVVVLLLDRHGHVAHRLVPRQAGAVPTVTDAPEGRVIDVLRRTLDLPTPPPDTAAGPWWATLWLDRIVATVAAAPTVPRTLLDLAHLHPLVGAGLSARDATVLHRLPPAPSVAGWEVMRRALASTDPAVTLAEGTIRRALLPLASPDQARWFDQGSFARWLEAALPPRPVLLAAVDSLLAPRLARALREAVGS